jgi:hypothetical protein
MNSKEIEELEYKYLMKYFHFLKFAEDEMLLGFKTKEKIKDDWYNKYASGISDFAVGAERIVYSLLNGKGIGRRKRFYFFYTIHPGSFAALNILIWR